jgi:hypothetical protein
MLRAAVLLRVALVVLLVSLGLLYAYGYAVGRHAVVIAPVLAPYRTPLHLAGLVGALPVLAGVEVAFDLSTVVERGGAASTVLHRFSLAGRDHTAGCLSRRSGRLVVGTGHLLAPGCATSGAKDMYRRIAEIPAPLRS